MEDFTSVLLPAVSTRYQVLYYLGCMLLRRIYYQYVVLVFCVTNTSRGIPGHKPGTDFTGKTVKYLDLARIQDDGVDYPGRPRGKNVQFNRRDQTARQPTDFRADFKHIFLG